MNELIQNIKDEMIAFATNLECFEKGNKAAGCRARKSSLKLTELFKQFRKESVHGAVD